MACVLRGALGLICPQLRQVPGGRQQKHVVADKYGSCGRCGEVVVVVVVLLLLLLLLLVEEWSVVVVT